MLTIGDPDLSSAAAAAASDSKSTAPSLTFTRWTESETGGLNSSRFATPELIKLNSFDGLPISAFLYRPLASKFPGARPVIVNIHG